MATTAARARSIYRSILRELPHRPINNPSPLKSHIRSSFVPSTKSAIQQLQQAEQFIQYAKAQRVYVTLLDRYNPGMSLDEEERVKLTMKRVGLDGPEEFKPE